MNILGIIPARGGSKRIPKKNARLFHGLPLLAWSIIPANESRINRVIVSTDDEEIARIAKEHGAEVPFLRPAELATDTMGLEPLLKHILEQLKETEGYEPDAVALLLPTYPLRTPGLINEAIDRFEQRPSDSLVSVIPALAGRNPHWVWKRNEAGQVTLFNGEPIASMITRSQDLPPTYTRNDMIFLIKKELLLQEKPTLFGTDIDLFEMDPFHDADINTEDDWFISEQKKLLQQKQQGLKKDTQK